MRYAARVDLNQSEIVCGLRSVGVKVHILGLPLDLLVGFRNRLFLFEIKDGGQIPSRRKLRPGQQKFMSEWQGYPIYKIESLADAYKILEIKVR